MKKWPTIARTLAAAHTLHGAAMVNFKGEIVQGDFEPCTPEDGLFRVKGKTITAANLRRFIFERRKEADDPHTTLMWSAYDEVTGYSYAGFGRLLEAAACR